MDRIRTFLANLSEQFEALKPRDRWAAVGLVLFVGALFAGGIVYTAISSQNSLAEQVRSAKEDLALVQELTGEYAILEAKIAAAETQMGQFKANQMNTYLESWATNANVNETLRVRPGSPQTVGDYTSTPYSVEVDRVELNGLLSFIYAIETSPYPIKVQSAAFKVTDRRDERTVSVDLELVAYTKGGA